MPLEKVLRTSVTDAVFDQLVAGVLNGELSAGSVLPAERSLTEAFGVNRQVVREALQRLAEAGLVEIRHGGRTRVTDFRTTGGLDLLPRLLVDASGMVDRDVALALIELRGCLGPEIASRCALRAADDLRSRVDQTAAEMAAVGDDLDRLAELDLQLWDALVDGSNNIAYRLAFNGLRKTYEPIAEVLRAALGAELRDHDNRNALARAVRAGSGEAAAAAARRLLARGESAIRSVLNDLAGADEEER